MNSLPLQSVLPKKVYLNNIIVGRQRDASFLIDDKKYDFSFTFPFHDYNPTFFFNIKLSDHLLWLSLDRLPPLADFSEKFKEVELSQLPSEIQPIILETCFKNVLDVVEEDLGVVISIESYTQDRPSNNFEDELQFSVSIEGVETPVYGALHMEGSCLEFLAALLERSSYSQMNALPSLEVLAYATIGEETLSLKEFKALNPADIILLTDVSYVNNGSCKVVIGDHLVYSGILKNEKVTLENLMDEKVDNEGFPRDVSYELEGEEEVADIDFSEENSEDQSVNENQKEEHTEDEESHGELPRELSDLPIHIVFEVGQKRLALKELQSLKSGYTFELESSLEHPVTIRANGRVIGSGELLKVGERIGVRVTSFTKK